jgi:hypothetical protein
MPELGLDHIRAKVDTGATTSSLYATHVRVVEKEGKEFAGSDIHAFVVGRTVVGAMMRKAARVMGLHVAGVDMIRSNRGPLVLEVNSSPGFAGVERVTGKDVAGKVINI